MPALFKNFLKSISYILKVNIINSSIGSIV